MAGKSTFLRQNALIALLAQIGSFVPARAAHIGIVDRLFSRVGAADDLARGRSTFMVEMVETAAILNQAGERSLVILDEIGRGTATFDGLSIAWAAIEHLHEANRCRALFATHYHELTALAAKLPRLFNATVRVKEWQGDVVFLHEVVPGAADRSYGIQVAKLAGLPAARDRARQVGAGETGGRGPQTAGALASTICRCLRCRSRAAAAAGRPSAAEELIEALDALHPDEMSPREALEALYALKAKLPKQLRISHPVRASVSDASGCNKKARIASHARMTNTAQRRPTSTEPAHAECGSRRRAECSGDMQHGDRTPSRAGPSRVGDHGRGRRRRRCADAGSASCCENTTGNSAIMPRCNGRPDPTASRRATNSGHQQRAQRDVVPARVISGILQCR